MTLLKKASNFSLMRRIFLLLASVILTVIGMSAQWNLQPGYHSYYEAGVGIGSGKASKTNFEVSTSQGYQIIPTYLYLGTGAAFQAFFNADGACGFPVFVNLRSHFSPSKVSPFFDVRVGYVSLTNSNIYTSGGLYLNPSLGLRFAVGHIGLNIRAGYTWEYAKANVTELDRLLGVYYNWQRKNIGGANVLVGIDF